MNPFKLIRAIQLLYQFAVDAESFRHLPAELVEGRSDEERDRLVATYRSIVRTCIVCLVVFGFVFPTVVVPLLACFLRGLTPRETLERASLGIFMFPVLAIIGLFLGAALGCLFAPPEFMHSPVGRRWMELVGTSNVMASRVICFLCAFLLFAFQLGYAWFVITAHVNR